MRLLLLRKYRPEATKGILSYRNRVWIRTQELPHPDFVPPLACIPEGCYAISGNYSEERGWYLDIAGHPIPCPVSFRPLIHGIRQPGQSIAPVTFFNEKGKGMFSRLANLTLTDRVYHALKEGEEVHLEIAGKRTTTNLSRCYLQRNLSA